MNDRRPRLVDGPVQLDWIERGACVGSDPTLFFPGTGAEGARQAKVAKAICAGCEVRRECLEYAISNGERYGIFGGMTRDERSRYKRGVA